MWRNSILVMEFVYSHDSMSNSLSCYNNPLIKLLWSVCICVAILWLVQMLRLPYMCVYVLCTQLRQLVYYFCTYKEINCNRVVHDVCVYVLYWRTPLFHICLLLIFTISCWVCYDSDGNYHYIMYDFVYCISILLHIHSIIHSSCIVC